MGGFTLPPQGRSELDYFPSLRDPFNQQRSAAGAAGGAPPLAAPRSLEELRQQTARSATLHAVKLLMGYVAALLQSRDAWMRAYRSEADVPVERKRQWLEFAAMAPWYGELSSRLLRAEEEENVNPREVAQLQEFQSEQQQLTWVQIRSQVHELWDKEAPNRPLEKAFPALHSLMEQLDNMLKYRDTGLRQTLSDAQQAATLLATDVPLHELPLKALEARLRAQLAQLLPTLDYKTKLQALQANLMPTGAPEEKDFLSAALKWTLTPIEGSAAKIESRDNVLAALARVKLSKY
jgi:hypothetical protein